MSDPSVNEKVRELFLATLNMSPEAVEALLLTLRAEGAHEVLAGLEALLEGDRRAIASPGFLRSPPDSDRRGPLADGRRLGRYELVELLGAGGFGEVYRAVDRSGFAEREVAIKLLNTEAGSTPAVVEQFKREGRILSELESDRIAKLYSTDYEDGRPYLVMELVRGQPFDEYCDAARLTVEDRARLLVDVCEAVQYLHSKAVWHLDIKPKNVLITHDGRVKLLDFGISRVAAPLGARGDQPVEGAVQCTPRWASPEQLAGDDLSERSDVYALGLLIHKAMTGRLPADPQRGEARRPMSEVVLEPFHDGPIDRPARVTPKQLASRFSRRPSALRRSLRPLDRVVADAIHDNPARRPSSPASVAETIARVFDRPVIGRGFGRKLGASAVALVAFVGLATVGLREWRWADHFLQEVYDGVDLTEADFRRSINGLTRWRVGRVDTLVRRSAAEREGPFFEELAEPVQGKRRADLAIALAASEAYDAASASICVDPSDYEPLAQLPDRWDHRQGALAKPCETLTRWVAHALRSLPDDRDDPADLTDASVRQELAAYALLITAAENLSLEQKEQRQGPEGFDIERLYTEDPSPAIHAACAYWLRRAGAASRIAELDRACADQPSIEDRGCVWRWSVLPVGPEGIETFVRVINPVEEIDVGVAMYEARESLFDPSGGSFRDPRMPASRKDAEIERFCRDASDLGAPQAAFRLPTVAELEAAWGADIATKEIRRYPFGRDDGLLRAYCHVGRADRHYVVLESPGQLRPSPTGFFDLNGNASEVYLRAQGDPYSEAVLRGAWYDTPPTASSWGKPRDRKVNRESESGFRIAVTLGGCTPAAVN